MFLINLLFSLNIFAAPMTGTDPIKALEDVYSRPATTKIQTASLKSQTLKLGPKAVPVLIKVMKANSYPEKNRWIATFMMGRVMGKKASPYIAKFTEHPHWMMRLAAHKTLLHLNETKYHGVYSKALKDPSLIVRVQGLQNISVMKITELGPHVWNMLYDTTNYSGDKGQLKRSDIVGRIITTLGDIGFKSAKKPMLSMAKNKKYQDIFKELDYSLSKLTNSRSPSGSLEVKRTYWAKVN